VKSAFNILPPIANGAFTSSCEQSGQVFWNVYFELVLEHAEDAGDAVKRGHLVKRLGFNAIARFLDAGEQGEG